MSDTTNLVSAEDYQHKIKHLNDEIRKLRAKNASLSQHSAFSAYKDLPVMILVVDPASLQLRFVNDHVCGIVGTDFEDLLGMPLENMIHPDYADNLHNGLDVLREKGSINNLGIVMETRRENVLEVMVNGKMEQFAGEKLMLLICNNVDSYKRIIKLNKILENRVKKRTATLHDQLEHITRQNRQLNDLKKALLNVMEDLKEEHKNYQEVSKLARELKRSNDDLEQFAFLTSHDLQEPLRMVSSFLQLLQGKMEEKMTQGEKEILGYAVDGAQRMKALLDGILEYSRVNTKGEPFKNIQIEEVLRMVMMNLSTVISEQNATIECKNPAEVYADKSQMIQLFQNLIGNAIKFRTEESPFIQITCETTPTHHLMIVRDNGIGIEETYLDRIFKIFHRLNNRSKYPGYGIGLSICRGIVQRHGGEIWAESAPGEGTTFFFTIKKDFTGES